MGRGPEAASRELTEVAFGRDGAVVCEGLVRRLRDGSGLNRTMAMQALMDLSEEDAKLRARVLPVVREALEGGTAAMRARARKLLGMKRTG